jgi:hypothetical protein
MLRKEAAVGKTKRPMVLSHCMRFENCSALRKVGVEIMTK